MCTKTFKYSCAVLKHRNLLAYSMDLYGPPAVSDRTSKEMNPVRHDAESSLHESQLKPYKCFRGPPTA